MHHYRTVTIIVSDHTLTSAIQLEITSKSPPGMHSHVENRTRVAARRECQPGPGIIVLVVCVKGQNKVRYAGRFRVTLTIGARARGDTYVSTDIVREVAGISWNGPFRASAYPPACKITFPLLSPPPRAIRFFPAPSTPSSFRYYGATINPRWAYRRIGRADCFICIISIENNPLPPRGTYPRRRLAMGFLYRPFFVTYRSLRNGEHQRVIFLSNIAWLHNAGNKPYIVRWIAYVKRWWSNKKRISAVRSF